MMSELVYFELPRCAPYISNACSHDPQQVFFVDVIIIDLHVCDKHGNVYTFSTFWSWGQRTLEFSYCQANG